ncbi:MAG TPA: fibronectin binding protein, partial [Candidatus Limivivens intestinipullorum]|nr:fibronectin binding protein [Candidatus Limivivens intestinipullorum]
MTRKTRRGIAAALMAAFLVAAAPAVCAEDSPQPEVSIIDITEDTMPEPSGEHLPTKIWTEEEDGTRLLKKTFVVDAGVSPSELMEGSITRRG